MAAAATHGVTYELTHFPILASVLVRSRLKRSDFIEVNKELLSHIVEVVWHEVTRLGHGQEGESTYRFFAP